MKDSTRTYLKVFLILTIISPPMTYTAHSIINQDRPIWFYILSGPLMGILFVITLYFQNKKKGKKDKK